MDNLAMPEFNPASYSDKTHDLRQVMTAKGLESPLTIWAREQCAAYINQYYPAYKQLNLLRAGTPAEQDQMTAFIDACRAWSNGVNPDPAALAAIQP